MPNREIKFSAVRPISKRADDQYKRSNFAAFLGDAIVGWSDQSSLVIALCGDWGTGKTSLLNMVEEYLKDLGADCPEIMPFNPWQYGSKDQYLDAFFRELQIVVGSKLPEQAKKELADSAQNYSTLLTAGAPFLILLWRLMAGDPTATHSVDPAIVPLLGGAATEGGKAILQRRAAIAVDEAKEKTSIKDLKLRIEERIKQANKRFLVVIDDVDRLNADEIRRIFQIVKCNADFSNVIYLLAFQRDIVEKALTSNHHEGASYLEKIAQVILNVPQVEEGFLAGELNRRIIEMFGTRGLSVDKERWEALLKIIGKEFGTGRKLERFLNSLSFYLGVFKGKKVLEVDAVDLIGIEFVRTFEPELHSVIHTRKDLIFNHVLKYRLFKANEKPAIEVKEALSELLSTNSQVGTQVFLHLFPHTTWVFDDRSLTSRGKDGRDYQDLVDARICEEVTFDRYFMLNVSSNDISKEAFDELLSKIISGDQFLDDLKQLANEGKIMQVLGRLDWNHKEIASGSQSNYVTQLMNLSELERWSTEVCYVNERFLLRQDMSCRRNLLSYGIANTTSLRALNYFARECVKANPNVFDKRTKNEVSKAFRRRFTALSKTEAIRKDKDVEKFAFWWSKLGGQRNARAWLRNEMLGDELYTLLEALIGYAASRPSPEESIWGGIEPTDLQWLHDWFRELMPKAEVDKLVRRLKSEVKAKKKLSERQLKLASTALEVLKSYK